LGDSGWRAGEGGRRPAPAALLRQGARRFSGSLADLVGLYYDTRLPVMTDMNPRALMAPRLSTPLPAPPQLGASQHIVLTQIVGYPAS
jgi:hypothetical protein